MNTIRTWSDLREYLYSIAAIATEGPTWVGFGHEIDGVTLQVKIAVAADELLLVMVAACPERELPPRRAMLEAAQLIPSVVIEDGFYIVRHWLRLGGSTALVDRAIGLIADGRCGCGRTHSRARA